MKKTLVHHVRLHHDYLTPTLTVRSLVLGIHPDASSPAIVTNIVLPVYPSFLLSFLPILRVMSSGIK